MLAGADEGDSRSLEELDNTSGNKILLENDTTLHRRKWD